MRFGKSQDLKCLSLFQNILGFSCFRKERKAAENEAEQEGRQENLTNEP